MVIWTTMDMNLLRKVVKRGQYGRVVSSLLVIKIKAVVTQNGWHMCHLLYGFTSVWRRAQMIKTIIIYDRKNISLGQIQFHWFNWIKGLDFWEKKLKAPPLNFHSLAWRDPVVTSMLHIVSIITPPCKKISMLLTKNIR